MTLERLLEGNKRFVEGKLAEKDLIAQRKTVIEGQKPFVTIVTCSDSRVVPEYIFDAGIGEVFTVIGAGNVCDDVALGSIEYGVEHLKTPLLILLGHTRCGAVTATCGCKGEKHGNYIDKIIEKIMPAVKENIDASIDENLRCVEKDILEKSKVVKELVDKKELRIVKMKYLLETGEVKMVE